jgi:hypothetical protein
VPYRLYPNKRRFWDTSFLLSFISTSGKNNEWCYSIGNKIEKKALLKNLFGMNSCKDGAKYEFT